MTAEQTAWAARNNALWCDTICRSHGLPGEWLDDIWLTRGAAPRFYPNAVTLSGSAGSAAQLACIRAMVEARMPGAWAVKDSFGTLDLAELEFRLLFEAEWLCRPATHAKPGAGLSGVDWVRVRDAAALADWETAWSGGSASEQPRLFLPTLLADETVAFIAAYQNRRIVAGAIANRTADVVGISNVFTPTDAAARFWAGCVATVIDAFPGLSIVGYEAGGELAIAQSLGFESLSPLRVWMRQAT